MRKPNFIKSGVNKIDIDIPKKYNDLANKFIQACMVVEWQDRKLVKIEHTLRKAMNDMKELQEKGLNTEMEYCNLLNEIYNEVNEKNIKLESL